MKYSKWIEQWLENYVKPTMKYATYKRYAIQCNLHVLPILGNLEVEKIGQREIQGLYLNLLDKALAPNTVNSTLSTVKKSLKQAFESGVTQVQTHLSLRCKTREKQIECFSRSEQHIIEDYVLSSRKRKYCGIIISLYSGLRIGELLALKWSDVDLEKGVIKVTKSCRDCWKEGRYYKINDTAKTAHSVRSVPLPRQITSYLKKIKKQSKSDYVIAGRGEHGAEIRTYQRSFGVLLKNLGIPLRGFHSLRHTFATRALEIGMDVKTLSELLGHSSPTVTLNRYAHSMLEYKTEMMNKLARQFFNK